MIKNVVKIVFIILLSTMIINVFSNSSFARVVHDGGGSGGGGSNGGSGSITSWDGVKVNSIGGNDDTGTAEAVQSIVAPAISVAQVIGIGVAVIMLIVLATKYMMAAPGDKADIKKHAIVYVVGAVILFSVTAILEIIKDFATKNITPSAS